MFRHALFALLTILSLQLCPAAFAETGNPEYLFIPANCESIGATDTTHIRPGAFMPSPEFKNVKGYVVDEDNPYFSSLDGVLFTKDNSALLQYPLLREGAQYFIPRGVQTIGEGAFRYADLESVVFPDSVQTIGPEAFYDVPLLTVEFPDGLTEIGESAFQNCALNRVLFPDSLLTIGGSAFEANNLSQIDLPRNLKSIGTYAFYGNPFAETSTVELPDSLEYIGEDIFQFGHSSFDYWSPTYLVRPNSAALNWARQHEYPYAIVE